MREDVSRRKALSLFGSVLGLGLALAKDAAAETAGTNSHHTKHPKRPTVQPASAPAATAEFKPTGSPSNWEMHSPSERPSGYIPQAAPLDQRGMRTLTEHRDQNIKCNRNTDSTEGTFRRALGPRARVALHHAVLHFDRAAHRVDPPRNSMIEPSPVRSTMRR